MHPDAVFVINKAKTAEAVHEEADAGPGCSDYLGQGFLGHGRNAGSQFIRLSKLSHQEQRAGQSLFARVEELVDQIGLGALAAGQHHRQKSGS